MLSLLTNTAALSARSALASTQASLARTQREISTGLRVSSPQDNGAYFAIATTMNTRIGNIEALDEGLKLTSAILAVTGTALAAITQLTRGIGADLVAAQQPGVDVAAVQSDIASKQAGIIAAAQAATFNGVNWLVTRVVGTDTDITTNDFDATRALTSDVTNARAVGTYDRTVDETTTQAVTRTLASSSTAQSADSSGVTFHVTENAINQPQTTTVSGNYHTNSSSGDPDGYRSIGIPVSIASDGSVISAARDFGPTELFATFSGTSGRSYVTQYTDGTDVTGTPPTALSRQVPYLDARDDVLDRTVFYSSTPTSLLTMSIRTAADATAASGAVGQALQGLSGASSFIGGLQSMVDGEATSNAALVDALKVGVGNLVDADMDADSTRLTALQTQQQLGVQALGIANSNAQVILQLFDIG